MRLPANTHMVAALGLDEFTEALDNAIVDSPEYVEALLALHDQVAKTHLPGMRRFDHYKDEQSGFWATKYQDEAGNEAFIFEVERNAEGNRQQMIFAKKSPGRRVIDGRFRPVN